MTNVIINYLKQYLIVKFNMKNSSNQSSEASMSIIDKHNTKETSNNNKGRNENVIKEINISITPKHINTEEIHAGSSTTRHNLGNLSICFSSPSPPGMRSVANINQKLGSNKKSPRTASQMNNVKFESMIGGQMTTESEATVFQAKPD